MPIKKFYFHNATTTDTGTLPGATTVSTATPGVTASGASTNRSMDDAIGAGQTNSTLSTTATKSAQKNWHRRFLSAPIAAQTIAAQNITFSVAHLQSNTNSLIEDIHGCMAVWRPSTGSLVGRFWDSTASSPGSGDSTNTVEANGGGFIGFGATSAVTAADGDILVFEMWTANTQAMATSYTNNLYYDGTAEGDTSNFASYWDWTTAITMLSEAVPRHPAIAFQDPALLATSFREKVRRLWPGWSRRQSGVLVPS